MTPIGFRPKNVTRKIVSSLPTRSRDVVNRRYGLGDDTQPMTLEAVGDIYGITRERVRQIVNQSLKRLRQSGALDEHQAVVEELTDLVFNLGGIVSERDLLEHISPKKDVQNHIYFLLDLAEPFTRHKADDDYEHRWHMSDKIADAVHRSLKSLRKKLKKDDLISEEDMIKMFKEHLAQENNLHEEHLSDDEILKRWLRISKKIGSNPLDEWGPSESPNIRVKSMRDYAYLVLRQHGSPLHFREVTEKINEVFERTAHVATTHNELIKDSRFILVGRGLYALEDWGYREGVVKDVITEVLKDKGPLTKEEVIANVLKERHVKENTILVNLQGSDRFQRLEDGRYTLS